MEELLGLTEPTWLSPWLLSAVGEAVPDCHVQAVRCRPLDSAVSK